MIKIAIWASLTLILYLLSSILRKKLIIGGINGEMGSIYENKWAIFWSFFYLIPILLFLAPVLIVYWNFITVQDWLAGGSLAILSAWLLYKSTYGVIINKKQVTRIVAILALLGVFLFSITLLFI
jgi:hypothetical protein